MVTSAAPGDHLVFSFSSHGTQVPDTDGDEADDADEAFATYDIAQKGNQWDVDTVIVDDELRDAAGQAAQGRAHGGLPRHLPLRAPGFAPRTCSAGAARASCHRPPSGACARSRRPAAATFKEVVKAVPVGSRPVLYAGCRSDQTSADATFGGRSSGAFTYYLLKALDADASRAPLGDPHRAHGLVARQRLQPASDPGGPVKGQEDGSR